MKEAELHMQWENIGVAPIYNPYSLAIRLVSETDSAIQLAIAGKTASGWYPMGQIEIE